MRPNSQEDGRAGREAITLPLLFLCVSLLSAIRVDEGGAVRFVGPTLLALVLAVMLGGLLLRAGVLAPERLVSSRRPALANANGVTVLLALLFASAQVFTVLTPEAGLMAILFSAFYFVLLWTTAAAQPRARHHAPVTGYAAFVALGLFFVGLLLLPHDGGAWDVERSAAWGTEIRRRTGELPVHPRRDDRDPGTA